jgi:6-phosphogluconolactonase
VNLIIHETPSNAASVVADIIVDAIANRQGRFSFGLAGGSTPIPTYKLLRSADVNWAEVDGWLSDERWVPPDSERSNGRMISEMLFDHVPATLYRPDWTDDTAPSVAAARYEDRLAAIHGTTPDLVFLGMGDDGHTASLFPGSNALAETERFFVENVIPATGEVRLTATLPLLHQANMVIFLATGASKAAALRDSLDGATPAGMVGEGRATVEWHVDRAAASLLS